MSDRIAQMRVEAAELEKRIDDLAEYIGNNELSETELADAREQLEHMVAYAEVLKRRIENS
jgi:hypothetical protein